MPGFSTHYDLNLVLSPRHVHTQVIDSTDEHTALLVLGFGSCIYT